MKQKVLFLFITLSVVSAQSTWIWSNRVHPELKWETISTKNYNIHYHQGIESIAEEGAIIAERVHPTLLEQMDVDSIPTIDIIFTSEDEIMNGFAMWTYQTFIWVDQNDAAIWLEQGKWLEQVVSHELQHIVLLHKTKSWFPEPFDRLIAGLPGWVVEGTAEYETEKWRPYRADLSHKSHILRNKMGSMDPHHDGFSKMLYWADRFGDSTITKTLAYRNRLKLFSFNAGFKKATGITVKQFNEDWRRHMNTYYYGYRAQKESYREIGETISLPIKRLQSFSFYKDSTKIALLGLDDKDQQDVSLMVAVRDTAKESKRYKKWKDQINKIQDKQTKSKKDSILLKKKFNEKVLWDKNEIDYGQFHGALHWSPNGRQLAYSKYHHGKNQSMVYDVKYYDLEKKQHEWLTTSMRATYPAWLDSSTIIFVSHKNSISNIYSVNTTDKKVVQITDFVENTQIVDLSLSPNNQQIVFTMSPKNGNLDVYIFDLNTKKIKRITEDQFADTRPIWHPDGTAISYTSNSNGVPNIHTINLSNNKTIINTDAGDGIWTWQWMPNKPQLLARTLPADVDTVRLVKVDPFRKPKTKPLSLSTNYTSWLTAGPNVDYVYKESKTKPMISKPKKYRFTKHPKHFTTLLTPAFGTTAWTDALGRHLFQATAFYNDIYPGSGYGISYVNAQHGPLWGVSISKNFDGMLREYDGAKMVDIKNGLKLYATHPMNWGESFSSNHQIDFSLEIINHDVIVWEEANNETGEAIQRDPSEYVNLKQPDINGKEGLVSLGYTWTNMRPHAWNFLHPKKGFGINAKIDWADSQLYGDYNYTRLKTDVYANVNLGGSLIYFRLKTLAYEGSAPAQKYVGLTDDQPIYFNGMGDVSSFFPENHNPRGWSGYRLGDRLIYGSLEYRMPIVPKSISLNLVSDFGNAWWSSEKTEKKDMVVTAGYELRFSLGPVVLSGGDAQQLDEWKDNKKPLRYYRLALTAPF